MSDAHGSVISGFLRLGRRLPTPTRQAVRRWIEPVPVPWGSVRSVRTNDPLVALTFDDGPDPIGTSAVLDALAEGGAHATFFVLADRVAKFPRWCNAPSPRVTTSGCTGPTTAVFTKLDRDAVRQAIADSKHLVEDAVGRPVQFFRPPYGAQTLATFGAARRCGLEVVVWSVTGEDWRPDSPADAAARTVAGCGPGDVVLLHDSRADAPADDPGPTVDRHRMTHLVLEGLSARQLTSVSLSHLRDHGTVRRSLWFKR